MLRKASQARILLADGGYAGPKLNPAPDEHDLGLTPKIVREPTKFAGLTVRRRRALERVFA